MAGPQWTGGALMGGGPGTVATGPTAEQAAKAARDKLARDKAAASAKARADAMAAKSALSSTPTSTPATLYSDADTQAAMKSSTGALSMLTGQSMGYNPVLQQQAQNALSTQGRVSSLQRAAAAQEAAQRGLGAGASMAAMRTADIQSGADRSALLGKVVDVGATQAQGALTALPGAAQSIMDIKKSQAGITQSLADTNQTNAQTTLIGEQSKLVVQQALKTAAEKGLVDQQTLTEFENTGRVKNEALKVLSDTKLVDAQTLQTGVETSLISAKTYTEVLEQNRIREETENTAKLGRQIDATTASIVAETLASGDSAQAGKQANAIALVKTLDLTSDTDVAAAKKAYTEAGLDPELVDSITHQARENKLFNVVSAQKLSGGMEKFKQADGSINYRSWLFDSQEGAAAGKAYWETISDEPWNPMRFPEQVDAVAEIAGLATADVADMAFNKRLADIKATDYFRSLPKADQDAIIAGEELNRLFPTGVFTRLDASGKLTYTDAAGNPIKLKSDGTIDDSDTPDENPQMFGNIPIGTGVADAALGAGVSFDANTKRYFKSVKSGRGSRVVETDAAGTPIDGGWYKNGDKYVDGKTGTVYGADGKNPNVGKTPSGGNTLGLPTGFVKFGSITYDAAGNEVGADNKPVKGGIRTIQVNGKPVRVNGEGLSAKAVNDDGSDIALADSIYEASPGVYRNRLTASFTDAKGNELTGGENYTSNIMAPNGGMFSPNIVLANYKKGMFIVDSSVKPTTATEVAERPGELFYVPNEDGAMVMAYATGEIKNGNAVIKVVGPDGKLRDGFVASGTIDYSGGSMAFNDGKTLLVGSAQINSKTIDPAKYGTDFRLKEGGATKDDILNPTEPGFDVKVENDASGGTITSVYQQLAGKVFWFNSGSYDKPVWVPAVTTGKRRTPGFQPKNVMEIRYVKKDGTVVNTGISELGPKFINGPDAPTSIDAYRSEAQTAINIGTPLDPALVHGSTSGGGLSRASTTTGGSPTVSATTAQRTVNKGLTSIGAIAPTTQTTVSAAPLSAKAASAEKQRAAAIARSKARIG